MLRLAVRSLLVSQAVRKAVAQRVSHSPLVGGNDKRHLRHGKEQPDRLQGVDHGRVQAAIEVVDEHDHPAQMRQLLRAHQLFELGLELSEAAALTFSRVAAAGLDETREVVYGWQLQGQ